VHGEHTRDFAGFHVGFDNYYTTIRRRDAALRRRHLRPLQAAGLIEVRTIEQYYDPVKQMFLPDRFIKGECPKCGAKDQYGDNCESCGAAYTATDLKNPYSAVSGAKPELRNRPLFLQACPTRAARPSCAAGRAAKAGCRTKPPTRCRNGSASRAKTS
jgi:methionyl-tRNA synthetase